jgi:membrane fusion protein, multidrug efflux system
MQKTKLGLVILLALCACSKSKPSHTNSLARVKVAPVQKKNLDITLPAMGHVRAFNSAEIKAQVEGLLKQVHFKEGHHISENDLLFTIDPAPYQAKVEEANAALVEDIAKFNYASDKVERYSALVEDEYVSKLDFEQYVEQKYALEAQVMRDRSDLNLARINLDYCSIKAPFSGIISKKLIDKGNLITNDGNTMAIINQINPVYIDFSIPEDHLQSVIQGQKKEPLSLYLNTSNTPKKKRAKLIMINNSVNENTGMVELRAQIENSDSTLWPGQFTSITLLTEIKNGALMIPQAAVNINEKGHYVFVIDSESQAHLKFVTLGQVEDTLIEATSGLKDGQRVVVEGTINVMPKAHVHILNE